RVLKGCGEIELQRCSRDCERVGLSVDRIAGRWNELGERVSAPPKVFNLEAAWLRVDVGILTRGVARVFVAVAHFDTRGNPWPTQRPSGPIERRVTRCVGDLRPGHRAWE